MQFHEELQPKVWDNFELKPEVKDKLNEIAEAFIEYAEIPKEGIKDIVITGSTANYNYTPYSDLDLHLIIDYDSLHENCPLVENYLWSVKSQFNKEHDISIYGIPVELYAEDMNASGVSNGIYSLQKDEWIKKPEKLPPTDNDAAVEARYNEFKEAVEKVVDKEDAEEIKNQMYIMRLTGLSEEGELSTENLTFKKLRDNGYLQKLNDIIHTEFDKELSLETKSKGDKRIQSLETLVNFIEKHYPKIKVIKKDFDTWYPIIIVEHQDFPELEFQVGANKLKENIYSFLASLKGYRDLSEAKAVTLDNFEDKLLDSILRAKKTANMMLKEGATRYYTADGWIEALQAFTQEKETRLSKALSKIKNSNLSNFECDEDINHDVFNPEQYTVDKVVYHGGDLSHGIKRGKLYFTNTIKNALKWADTVWKCRVILYYPYVFKTSEEYDSYMENGDFQQDHKDDIIDGIVCLEEPQYFVALNPKNQVTILEQVI